MIEAESTDLRYYSVIYNLIDEVKAAMSGMLSRTETADYRSGGSS